jgi:hypothetical protein
LPVHYYGRIYRRGVSSGRWWIGQTAVDINAFTLYELTLLLPVMIGLYPPGGSEPVVRSPNPRVSRRSSSMSESKPAKFRWKLFTAGMVAITVGYILLAANDITLAPVLLVLGYCLLIPLSFL